MTNEEIEEAAREYLAVESGRPFPEEVALLAKVMRSLVSQAYEEAAQAVCWNCEDGRPAMFLVEPRHADSHSFQSATLTGYVHEIQGEQAGRVFLYPCAAASIRALKDSLVQEPVAPT